MTDGRSTLHGFTTIELLIVITIGAILAAIAAPSLRQTLNTMRQSSATGLLMGDLNMARAEAIKRNARVLVCGRNGAGTGCAGVTDWRVGWVVCVEAAVPNTCVPSTATNPNPLVVRPPLDNNLTATASDVAVRFNPNSTQGAGVLATVDVNGTWADATVRRVSVAATGNISK